MKKSALKKTRMEKNRKLAVAATIAAAPLLAGPALAQRGGMPADSSAAMSRMTQTKPRIFIKYEAKFIKWHEQVSIAGMDDGHTIYANSRGEHFYIDPSTGDMKFLSNDIWIKFNDYTIKGNRGAMKYMKFDAKEKHWPPVLIVGVDAAGNTLQKNQQGEVFYVDPSTGDMVYVK